MKLYKNTDSNYGFSWPDSVVLAENAMEAAKKFYPINFGITGDENTACIKVDEYEDEIDGDDGEYTFVEEVNLSDDFYITDKESKELIIRALQALK